MNLIKQYEAWEKRQKQEEMEEEFLKQYDDDDFVGFCINEVHEWSGDDIGDVDLCDWVIDNAIERACYANVELDGYDIDYITYRIREYIYSHRA